MSTVQENKLIPKAVQYTEDYDAIVRAEHFLPTKMWRIDQVKQKGWILWDLAYNTVLFVGDDGTMTVDMPELHVPLLHTTIETTEGSTDESTNGSTNGSTDESRQDSLRE